MAQGDRRVQLFQCQRCGQTLFFENSLCESCGASLGYDAEATVLHALVPASGNDPLLWSPIGQSGGGAFRFCANVAQGVCNWLVPAASAERLCRACRHNRTIPDLSDPAHQRAWQRLEAAKHRLIYQLIRLRLPLPSLAESPAGLAFDFLADDAAVPGSVLTGHASGLITVNLREADDAEREQMRVDMHEPYRTLLGHFRHEVGHFYWDLLLRDGVRLEECREIFGDDREDYAAALRRHYAEGAPSGWQQSFISPYASAHPWEDFAETWAHYLHIADTLETASAFQLGVHPKRAESPDLHADIRQNPYAQDSVDDLIESWIPLTFALNSLNRSMGLPDLYPFVLNPAAIAKLGFIHRLLQNAAG